MNEYTKCGMYVQCNMLQHGSINNLRYTDDTTLMAENKEELKNLLMKVKEKRRGKWKRKVKMKEESESGESKGVLLLQ